MLHRDNREIVNNCDHLTIREIDTACSRSGFGGDHATPETSIAPLVPMCQKRLWVSWL
jgi:hypothetical protein